MRTMILAAAVAASLAGCTTMVEVRDGARQQHADVQDRAASMLAARREAPPSSGAIITDAPYVDVRVTRRTARYPASFSRTVTMNEPMGLPMTVLTQRVQAMTGVAIIYQPELMGASGNALPASPASVSMDDASSGDLPSLAALLPQVQSSARNPGTSVPISYTGDAVGLFNAIAGAVGASWDYDEATRTVTLYKYRTETFRVPAVQGQASSAATMGGMTQGTGGQQALSNASATGSYRADASIWKDLETTLKQMVSAEGVYSISQSTGTVTVRDRPDRVAQVRRYMDNTTAALSRQVDVEVTIYRVLSRADDTRALNWKALFENVANKYGIALDTMANRPAMDGGANLTVTIPDTSTKWGGSQIVMEALSTLGDTSVEQSTSLVTSNNQPAPFKVVRRTTYLKEFSQGMTSSGGAQYNTGPTLTPGEIETGLNMYVIPHVMEDGKRVKLRVQASISTLEAMNKSGTAEAFIQTPDTASREFQSEAWLTSGETLVLAGFQQTETGMTTKSPLDKRLWLLGGSSQASKRREIVVIALRPVVSAVRSRI